MLKYKLTNWQWKTHKDTKWGEGVTHETNGEGDLCSEGWLHYYHHPVLAVLFNPIHAQIREPILWECEAEGKHKDDMGLKGGCTKLTTIKQIPLPKITQKQKLEIALRCSLQAYRWNCCNDLREWEQWVEKYLATKTTTSKDIQKIFKRNFEDKLLSSGLNLYVFFSARCVTYAMMSTSINCKVARSIIYSKRAYKDLDIIGITNQVLTPEV